MNRDEIARFALCIRPTSGEGGEAKAISGLKGKVSDKDLMDLMSTTDLREMRRNLGQDGGMSEEEALAFQAIEILGEGTGP